MSEPFRPVAPVDPTNLRPLLFLDVAREMMVNPDWSHRAVSGIRSRLAMEVSGCHVGKGVRFGRAEMS
jgi:hypothetical protein